MSTKIIVGLGNPGTRYEGTRHNIGFAVLDRVAQKLGIAVDRSKWDALIGEGRYAGQKLILVKPQIYMNLSGKAVRQVTDFYHVEPADVLVLVDDIDIHLGTVRIREKGSAGTHNGLRSLVQELGSDAFARVKIATGHRSASWDLADFVLARFAEEDQKTIEEETEAAAQAVLDILDHDLSTAMNTWNGWLAPSIKEQSEEKKALEAKQDQERERQDAFRKGAKRCGD